MEEHVQQLPELILMELQARLPHVTGQPLVRGKKWYIVVIKSKWRYQNFISNCFRYDAFLDVLQLLHPRNKHSNKISRYNFLFFGLCLIILGDSSRPGSLPSDLNKVPDLPGYSKPGQPAYLPMDKDMKPEDSSFFSKLFGFKFFKPREE